MKWILITLALLISPFTVAGYGTGGVPSVPCYIDGKYKGTIAINIASASAEKFRAKKRASLRPALFTCIWLRMTFYKAFSITHDYNSALW
ncbi:hypothetical protein [Vibrio breoganii]|uniref:hypothetical protein n=1 Tax=Vibrio breoganii TaxID=553239 RepID=UPI001F51F647|nr:hypothetical protein [Vibrio breoganii]